MSDSKKSDDDIPEDFGYSLSGSVKDTSNEGSKTICQVCGMSFSSYSAYQVHFASSHRG